MSARERQDLAVPFTSGDGIAYLDHFDSVQEMAESVARDRKDYDPPVAMPKLLLTDTGWDPVGDPVYGRTEGASANLHIGGHYDYLGAPSRSYLWGVQSFFTNPETAGVTAIDGVGQGWLVRAMGATARQIGKGGDGHAVEVISGQYLAEVRATTTNGSPYLDVSRVVLDGSRFCIGDIAEGPGIPAGAKVVELVKNGRAMKGKYCLREITVTGGAGYQVGDILTLTGGTRDWSAQLKVRTITAGGAIGTVFVIDAGSYTAYSMTPSVTGGSGTGATVTGSGTFIPAGMGYVEQIKLDMNATATATNVAVQFISENTMNVGVLVTGSGNGGEDKTGNPNGRAIQIQAYGSASYRYGIMMGASALRSNDGVGIGFISATGDKGIEFDTVSMNYAFRVTGGAFAQSMIDLAGGSATYGLRFGSLASFSGAAIFLQAQDIDTDATVGMKIGKGATRKIGFWGATPVARPTAIPDATSGTQLATINSILAALRSMGLIES